MQRIVLPIIIYCLSACQSNNNRIDLVIKDVALFDGNKYWSSVNIGVDGDTIIFISTSGAYPECKRTLDGRGSTIIPPLMNAHVHVWSQYNLKEALRHGVFALFDMHSGERHATGLKTFRDSLFYAYYYTAGPGATVPGGHGTQYGIDVPTIDSSLAAEQYVMDRVKNGSDYIKILREPTMNVISFSDCKKIIDEGHRLNRLVVAHVTAEKDAEQLARDNIDGFVHVWMDTMMPDVQLDSLKRTGIFIVPTLITISRALPWYKKRPGFENAMNLSQVKEQVRRIHKKGIPILAGTDSPNFKYNYGSDLYKELFLLSECGLSNMEVLKAATANVYKSFRLYEFHNVEVGKDASFVLVKGNPVENLKDLNHGKMIFKKGIVVVNTMN